MRVYFPYYHGQPYKINVWYGEQILFEGEAVLLERARNSANNKRYWDIDPDALANLESKDLLFFYHHSEENHYYGCATVEVLRELADIAFSADEVKIFEQLDD
ncbi:hypothetical protein niasHT_014310 [Heterodera trifolii]|uniref:Uncharacterized protein n=1 Tax=Heterodera trifolii TaxID=157864 RepID=A0ABD2L7Q6_9BILA